mmetsp:Transcript_24799/g.55854  ORF Transcript_24799/g.55854 Transcript_24799/m.55854 type:complete len:236 (+) Transcript_24799:276-983(+)
MAYGFGADGARCRRRSCRRRSGRRRSFRSRAMRLSAHVYELTGGCVMRPIRHFPPWAKVRRPDLQGVLLGTRDRGGQRRTRRCLGMLGRQRRPPSGELGGPPGLVRGRSIGGVGQARPHRGRGGSLGPPPTGPPRHPRRHPRRCPHRRCPPEPLRCRYRPHRYRLHRRHHRQASRRYPRCRRRRRSRRRSRRPLHLPPRQRGQGGRPPPRPAGPPPPGLLRPARPSWGHRRLPHR